MRRTKVTRVTVTTTRTRTGTTVRTTRQTHCVGRKLTAIKLGQIEARIANMGQPAR